MNRFFLAVFLIAVFSAHASDQATAKLGNEAFLAKAPEAVKEKIQKRLAAAEADIERISGQLAALPQG